MKSYKLSKEDKAEMKILRKQGLSGSKIGERFGVTTSCVYYHTTPGLREKSNLCSKKNEHNWKNKNDSKKISGPCYLQYWYC